MNALPHVSRLRCLAALLSLLVAVNGCSVLKPAKAQEQDYLLTAEATSTPAAGQGGRACILRILPVEVPDYLQTRDMAVRTGADQIVFTPYHQWAESLEAGIRRVLAEDLKSSPEIREVLTDEMSPAHTTVEIISVHILTCEGNDTKGQGSVHFKAAWELSRSGTDAVLAHGVYDAPSAPWHPGDYEDLAGQLSRATAGLSRTLEQAILTAR